MLLLLQCQWTWWSGRLLNTGPGSFWFGVSVTVHLVAPHLEVFTRHLQPRRPASVCLRSTLDSYTATIAWLKRNRGTVSSLFKVRACAELRSTGPVPQLWIPSAEPGAPAQVTVGEPTGSAEKKPGPQREVRAKKSNLGSLGREDTSFSESLSSWGGRYGQSGLRGPAVELKIDEGK